MNVDPDKIEGPIENGYFQPSLFEDNVVEAHRTQHFVIPRFTSKRRRKRGSRMENGKVVNLRAYKGEQIASSSQIQRHQDYYLVPSQSGEYSYKIDAKTYTCECADFQWQRRKCKHIIAVEIALGKSRPLDARQLRDAKYTQNWQAYNKSQTSEKSMFLVLLSELTRQIDEPEQTRGRPAINLGDMVFSCVFKVYSLMASRRFSTDLKDAKVKGYIHEIPHFSSLNRYMEKASLSRHLEALVEETAKPFSGLETDFAIDSTGLSISNTVAWSHARHKDTKLLQSKNWVKVHCCIGTRTNIITSVVITDKTSHDSKHFVSLIENTSRNFEVREVSADAAYSNNRNLDFTTMKNIGTFIPFKDKTSFNNKRSTGAWHRLYHFFQFNRAEFLQSYGKRNNAETTFHMLKSKFGSTLKSRNWEAQKNEALCKVVCHNIVCLAHAMSEFGAKPESFEPNLLPDAKLLNLDENVLKV